MTLNGKAGERVMEGSGELLDGTLVVRITNNLEPGTIRCTGSLGSEPLIRATCVGPGEDTFGWELTRVRD